MAISTAAARHDVSPHDAFKADLGEEARGEPKFPAHVIPLGFRPARFFGEAMHTGTMLFAAIPANKAVGPGRRERVR